MYFSDRSHKFNQSTLPAEDTAMAQAAEQDSLEVTVTSSRGHRGLVQQDGCGLAGQWVPGSRNSSHSRPDSSLSRAILLLLDSKDF